MTRHGEVRECAAELCDPELSEHPVWLMVTELIACEYLYVIENIMSCK